MPFARKLGSRAGAFLAAEKEVLLAFFASRLLVWVVGWLAWKSFKHGDYGVRPGPELWKLLDHWDAGWYRSIVENGYNYTPGVESSVAFFPLLPLSVWILKALGVQSTIGGFVVSNVALLASAILLRRLVRLDFREPERVPERAVWLLLFCPMTFFYSTTYTESLFLMLSIAALFAARQQRWLAAGIFGAFLTATRGNALLILIPLAWEAFVQAPRSKDVTSEPRGVARSRWWLALVPAGLVAYATFLHFRFGDALAFAHAMKAWGREIASPLKGFQNTIGLPDAYGQMLIGSAVAGVLLCLLSFVMRLRASYQLYAGAMIVLYLCTTLLHSLPRYLSVLFPFYIALAIAGRRSEGFYILALAASVALMALCLALYVCDYLMV